MPRRSPTILTPDDVARFERDGFVRVPEAFPAEVALELQSEVWAELAIEPGNEGGTLEIAVGDRKLSRKLNEPTAGWQSYRRMVLGTVTLDEVPEDGVNVRVRGAEIPAGKALTNLRVLELIPLGD